jgi:hypothetical protein
MSFSDSNTPSSNGQKVPFSVGQSVISEPLLAVNHPLLFTPETIHVENFLDDPSLPFIAVYYIDATFGRVEAGEIFHNASETLWEFWQNGFIICFGLMGNDWLFEAKKRIAAYLNGNLRPQPVQLAQAADMRGQTASPLVTIEKSQNFSNLWLVRVSREGQTFAFGHVAVSPRQKIWKFQYQNNNIATGSLNLDWQTAAKSAILLYLSPKQSFIMDALDVMEQTLLAQVYSEVA